MTNAATTASVSVTPSIDRSANVVVTVAPSVPDSAAIVGVPVGRDGDAPAALGVGRDRLEAAGFDAGVGSTLVVPSAHGPVLVAVGLGDTGALDAGAIRNAAAAFARAASTHAELVFSLAETDAVDAGAAAQAVVEGVLLARYRYNTMISDPPGTVVTAVTLVTDEGQQAAATAGAERGRVMSAVAQLARDLANAPHNHMTASTFADIAESLGADRGLTVEVFDKEALLDMGCGGLLGVNAGSSEPPRMIKLTYRPESGRPESGDPAGRLTLVGKGIMYDSGGIALKPGDESHSTMKNDMSGAGAILSAMSALSELGCRNQVVGYLMCTDNMPSGTAMALGDVITIRGGTTVEVINTDAEGRLVLADGLVLATEEPTDAIVDIATLTGACMRALGTQIAGVMGNHQGLVDQITAVAEATDEPVWQLPLADRYDKDIVSTVADVRNMGTTPNGGAIHAALFLAKFVGDVPWAHLDIAGTAQSSGDAGWQTSGCTGSGARLLAQLAVDFSAPGS